MSSPTVRQYVTFPNRTNRGMYVVEAIERIPLYVYADNAAHALEQWHEVEQRRQTHCRVCDGPLVDRQSIGNGEYVCGLACRREYRIGMDEAAFENMSESDLWYAPLMRLHRMGAFDE